MKQHKLMNRNIIFTIGFFLIFFLCYYFYPNAVYSYYSLKYSDVPPIFQVIKLNNNIPISFQIYSFKEQNYNISLIIKVNSMKDVDGLRKVMDTTPLKFKVTFQDEQNNLLYQEIVETHGFYAKVLTGDEGGFYRKVDNIKIKKGRYIIQITPLSDSEELSLFNTYQVGFKIHFRPLIARK